MLFDSALFIFVYLPLILSLYVLCCKQGAGQAAKFILVFGSLFFYAWWNPLYLILLVGSICFNYLWAEALLGVKRPRQGRLFLSLGIAINLIILGYFKYSDFFLGELRDLLGVSIQMMNVILPLGISFFTFQQIAYLVDSHRGEVDRKHFLDYSLFVSFFPQLIAGPIVKHQEIFPQISGRFYKQEHSRNIAVGLTIFSIGLFKKIVLADGFATYSNPVFEFVEMGGEVSFCDAWAGLIAFSFQIYFDFSGYSDMAIGLARMFGIKLPVNFYSPYKATNLVEFWRRWHITLSRFLRDYLYIALGGNRCSGFRKYQNLLVTMIIGGLWHGAGWNFVIWGGIHGLGLVICHKFREITAKKGVRRKTSGRAIGCISTFFFVTIAWIFFRAESFGAAIDLLGAIIGVQGIFVFVESLGVVEGSKFGSTMLLSPTYESLVSWDLRSICLFGTATLVVFVLPNTFQVLKTESMSQHLIQQRAQDSLLARLSWQPTVFWTLCISLTWLLSYLARIGFGRADFIYFQF